jgi:hypothetical protein
MAGIVEAAQIAGRCPEISKAEFNLSTLVTWNCSNTCTIGQRGGQVVELAFQVISAMRLRGIDPVLKIHAILER